MHATICNIQVNIAIIGNEYRIFCYRGEIIDISSNRDTYVNYIYIIYIYSLLDIPARK